MRQPLQFAAPASPHPTTARHVAGDTELAGRAPRTALLSAQGGEVASESLEGLARLVARAAKPFGLPRSPTSAAPES